jgi:hypothetical protein
VPDNVREASPLLGSIYRNASKVNRAGIKTCLPWLLVVGLTCTLLLQQTNVRRARPVQPMASQTSLEPNNGKIFVSYSYFEKDDIQVCLSLAPAGNQCLQKCIGMLSTDGNLLESYIVSTQCTGSSHGQEHKARRQTAVMASTIAPCCCSETTSSTSFWQPWE